MITEWPEWIQDRTKLHSLLRGRVAHLPEHGGWGTDREAIRTIIAPNRRGEVQGVAAYFSLMIKGTLVIPSFQALLTNVYCRTVSTDPNDDNIMVSAWTIPVGHTEERVPIGSHAR